MRVHVDGFVEFVGRSKNVVVTGGLNVYPDEVSEVLLSHPEVCEAVTLGVPQEVWGEAVVSCIVATPGATPDETDITGFLRSQLSDYKVPKRVLAFDAFPRTASGKVDVVRMRDDAAQKLSAGQEPCASGAPDLDSAILEIAARLFMIPAEGLRMDTPHYQVAGWDSMQHMNLILQLEQRFHVEFAPQDIVSIQSLEAAAALVRAKLDVQGDPGR